MWRGDPGAGSTGDTGLSLSLLFLMRFADSIVVPRISGGAGRALGERLANGMHPGWPAVGTGGCPSWPCWALHLGSAFCAYAHSWSCPLWEQALLGRPVRLSTGIFFKMMQEKFSLKSAPF